MTDYRKLTEVLINKAKEDVIRRPMDEATWIVYWQAAIETALRQVAAEAWDEAAKVARKRNNELVEKLKDDTWDEQRHFKAGCTMTSREITDVLEAKAKELRND